MKKRSEIYPDTTHRFPVQREEERDGTDNQHKQLWILEKGTRGHSVIKVRKLQKQQQRSKHIYLESLDLAFRNLVVFPGLFLILVLSTSGHTCVRQINKIGLSILSFLSIFTWWQPSLLIW